MRAFITRELIVMTRHPAVPVTVLANALLLSAFVVVWAPGVPLLQGWNFYEQTRLVNWALLTISLPWVAARSAMPERGTRVVLTSAVTGRSPAEILAGRTAAVAAVLACVACAGLPAALFAQQMAAVPLLSTLPHLLPLLGACIVIAAINTAVTLMVANRLHAWLVATVLSAISIFAVTRTIPSPVLGGMVAIALGLTLAAAAATRANVSLLYLAEDDA